MFLSEATDKAMASFPWKTRNAFPHVQHVLWKMEQVVELDLGRDISIELQMQCVVLHNSFMEVPMDVSCHRTPTKNAQDGIESVKALNVRWQQASGLDLIGEKCKHYRHHAGNITRKVPDLISVDEVGFEIQV
jgi:hypothetical protein